MGQLVLISVPHRNLGVQETLKKSQKGQYAWNMETGIETYSTVCETENLCFTEENICHQSKEQLQVRFFSPPPSPSSLKKELWFIYTPITLESHLNQVLESDSRTPFSQMYVVASTRPVTAKVSSTRLSQGLCFLLELPPCVI